MYSQQMLWRTPQFAFSSEPPKGFEKFKRDKKKREEEEKASPTATSAKQENEKSKLAEDKAEKKK